ncbi:hypothetical protein [Kibdelosporangium aridum]|uniref:hypothetical protein n=1 Tax=Kibdelosporangium aridum TaxID=2030 RepID=UPI00068AF729
MEIDQSTHRRQHRGLSRITSPREIPPPQDTWTDEQWAHLQHGMHPRGMDHRWWSYVVGQRLFLHRSWRGDGVFEVEFERADDGWRAVAAVVETAENVNYRTRTDTEISNLLGRLIHMAAG